MAVKKLPNGRWEASYRDPAGRERVKHHRTRTEADRWLTSVKNELNRGDYVDPRLGRSPFSHWASDWLDTAAHLKPKTRVDYETMLRVHVLPVFADQAIAAIQPGDVRRFIADKVASGAAPGTVRSIGRSSGSSSQPHRPKAPSEPSPVTGSGSRPRPRRTWSSSAPIRSRTSPPRSTPRYATLIRLAAYTGLRAGEIGALRIGRVDLDARRLTIAESVTEVQGHGLVFGEPKTYERRSVTLPGFLRGDLATHLHHRDADPKAFVFTSPDGAVLNHKNFYRRTFKPAVRTAGLPDRTRFHDLRHTCAALCIALGAHPKAIQERLGHSSITVTLDRYGHLFPKLDETLTTRLDDLRRNATGGPAANAIP